MLNLVTGVPGASKTAFVVTKLDEIERKNKVNLKKNQVIFEHNLPLFEKFRDDFEYYIREVGSAHQLKMVLDFLPKDYFDFLKQDFDDLRPDYYFQRSTQYNEIVERINEREGKQKFEYMQPVRTIYSNINALKIDYTRSLIYDWREAPDGSIFAIDEVQLVQPYEDLKTKDKIVMDLTIHRHRGFDFFFITQFPSLLHPVIQKLVSPHYHVTRPFGRTPKVYLYGTTRTHPESLLNKLNPESKFTFKPQDRIFKLYKSTTIDTTVKRTPPGLVIFALFLIGAVAMFMWGLNDKREAKKAKEVQQTQQTTDISKNQPSNNVQSQNNQVNQQINQVSYDPTKPFDDDKIQQQIKYDVKNKPVFSGCIKYGKNKYKAYTQQGTLLKVDPSVCKRLIEDRERPFDYFSDRDKQNNTATGAIAPDQEKAKIMYENHQGI
ncbi:zonular occludens toxin domain-containing protein [Acinetobacter nectaris]|uniref:zonular occludens toxin domain-containing protein n=1 Tax=Acinetobacter nectaris TaxID=1219382 RepID=UPI001F1E90BA|nr:zonular occludens toxin domain-containing protein [Acinetobacter nectaris]MCF9047517.1 hypothetical protein [Acinetobacter nectaris]